ncbi:hypothetical protein ACSAZK_00950 [Methanosarcina sp. Mfa9]|uniref:hypothetical protein n=1 Tax=Methanosarcina sp. Mfa9 TaxID=3439063 RepID=UPI003F87121C
MAQAPGGGTGIGVHVIPGSEKSPGKKMLWKMGLKNLGKVIRTGRAGSVNLQE